MNSFHYVNEPRSNVNQGTCGQESYNYLFYEPKEITCSRLGVNLF